MDTTTPPAPPVPDVTRIPLAVLRDQGAQTNAAVLGRALPGTGMKSVPVAAFNSSI